MRICLLCATRRGHLFLKTLHKLAPDADFLVFSFREEPWEPPFLDDIKSLTQSMGAEFHETKNVAHQRWDALWGSTQIDLMFSVSWRCMIPPRIYKQARNGAFVLHDSLLPQYRGFAPTAWAIINGEKHTGATLFEIAEDVDAGDIVDQEPVPISEDDTIGTVLEAVTQASLRIIRHNFKQLAEGTAPRQTQDHSKATFTCKLTPEDARIDWSASTEMIYNLIRGYTTPYPGAYTLYDGEKLYILGAKRIEHPNLYAGRVPGRPVRIVRDEGVAVLTGDSELCITTVRRENEEPAEAAQIIKRFSSTLGR